MDWEAAGAIGELLGAVAVIVTLIFLILQLRQNTRAIQGESARATFNQGSAWMYQLIQDPAIAHLYRRGLAQELESPDDRLRFHLLMQALFNQWAIAYNYQSGELIGVTEADVSHVLSSPGGRAYWERAKKRQLHARRFIDYVTAIEKKLDSHHSSIAE